MNEQATMEPVESTELVPVDRSPAAMLDKAIERGMEPAQMQGILDLYERWEAGQARRAYHTAMAAFKEDPPQITKDRAVSFEARGGKTSYRHASLANVTSTINTALSKHGLSASWKTGRNDGDVVVTCTITHVLGHSESTELSAPSDKSGAKNDIQAIGSAVSYLERYTLLALTGLATFEMDDDGGPKAKPEREANTPQEPTRDETKYLREVWTAWCKMKGLDPKDGSNRDRFAAWTKTASGIDADFTDPTEWTKDAYDRCLHVIEEISDE